MNKLTSWLAFVLAAALAGCGGGDETPTPTPAAPGIATLDSEGGSVAGQDGATLTVPRGAINRPTTLTIARDSNDAPARPPEYPLAGNVYAVTPHGTTFGEPATVRLPFDRSMLAAGERVALLKADLNGAWQLIDDVSVDGDHVVASIDSLSFLVPVRRLGQVIYPPNPPPAEAQISMELENSTFNNIVAAAGTNLRIRQQDDPAIPANIRISVNIPATSSLWQNGPCDQQYGFSFQLRYSSVTLYRRPGETGTRVWRDSTFMTEQTYTSVGTYYDSIGRTLTFATTFNPVAWGHQRSNVAPPIGTTDEGGAFMIELGISCNNGVAYPSPASASPIVITQGFADVPVLFTQLPGPLVAAEGQAVMTSPWGAISSRPEVYAITSWTWEVSDTAGANWASVPNDVGYIEGDGTLLPGVYGYFMSSDGDVIGRGRVADNGRRLRLTACAFPRGSALGTPQCVTSAPVPITVTAVAPVPPRFNIQPPSSTFEAGQTVDLAAGWEGTPAPNGVTWEQLRPGTRFWVAVDPAEFTEVTTVSRASEWRGTTRLRLDRALTLADNGLQLRARYTTSAGSAMSDAATVSVVPALLAPTFTVQPADTTVASGRALQLNAVATGSTPLSYQWFKDGVSITGANGQALIVDPANTTNNGNYTLEVSNRVGTLRSQPARVTVTPTGPPGIAAPAVTRQPQPTTVGAGGTAAFVASFSGNPTGYQWERNGVALPGENGPALVLANAGAANEGDYTLVASNLLGSVRTQVARLTVAGAPAPASPPAITTQPVGLALTAGQTATFAVAASGSGPLAYQWRLNGTDVAGANGPVLTIADVGSGNPGTYTVIVSNSAGSATSSSAGLVVVPVPGAPAITLQPASRSVIAGQPATFTLAVAGNPAPQCLWTRNSAAIDGATSCAGYTTPATTSADNGAIYNVFVYSPGGVAIGNGAVLTVQPLVAPTITVQPQSVTVTEGQSAGFSAAATSNGPLTFQWQRSGDGIAGATDNVYSLGSASTSDNGAQFRVRVCNGPQANNLCTLSNTVTLTVNVAVPVNALTATQIVAGQEWSMALRPDRTVWGWGSVHRVNGTVQYANPTLAPALRPVRMYPAALSDIRAISGWFNGFWALKGEPGSTSSRVLHWGRADAGSDGRGGDGNGSLGSSIPPRDNEAAPVEVLERVNNMTQPVDRVCAIAGGGEQLAMIRAINSAGTTTDCNAGSAKTVWFVGSLLGRGYESTGVAFAMPGLPIDSPPAVIFTGQTTSGSPGLAIALEDGRVYGLGANPYGGFGVAASGSGIVGGLGGPQLLPATWGNARTFGMSFYYSLFVVRADGSVVTSGYDGFGEMGLGSVTSGSTLGPLPVKAESCASLPCADTLTGVTALASGNGAATLALKNGQILGWGSRGSGLLGPVASGGQPFPRPVASPGVSGFTALSASNVHALVIGPGNVVYAWGNGLRGTLGDGTDSTRTAPGMVTVP
jgi:alpha-tubulin suppressor-like RCC1 family protein